MLKSRIEHLEMRSPIGGLVVSGDLKRSEGMPMATGQVLFEIAPIDEMRIEVAIPEEDVRLARPGMPVRIWLDAFPSKYWDARLETIHPRAELKEHQNVFVAELTLPNYGGKMRPGMRGSARVESDRHMLGWNLFHKAFAAATRWLGW
jgi:hypothetical protein